MSPKILLIFFFILASGCDVLGPVEDTNNTAKEVNKSLEEVGTQLDSFIELIDSCMIRVFIRSEIDPFHDFAPGTKTLKIIIGHEGEKLVYDSLIIDLSSLEEYQDRFDETLFFYKVPLELIYEVPLSKQEIRIARSDFCEKLVHYAGQNLNSFVDGLIAKALGSEDLIASYISSIKNKTIFEKTCRELRISKKIKELELLNTSYLSFSKKKKINKEIDGVQDMIVKQSCRFSTENKLLSRKEIEGLAISHEIEWSSFKKSWGEYYSQWVENKSLVFNEEQRRALYIPELRGDFIKTEYAIKRDSYAEQMSTLVIVKGVIPYKNPASLKEFMIEKGGGLTINAQRPFSFSNLSLDYFEIIGQIFERLFYKGNSKYESLEIRRYISDAVFAIYQIQIEKEDIEESELFGSPVTP